MLLACIVGTFACKKNKDNDPDEIPYGDDVIDIMIDDYSKLKVGNYWIYQEYTVDSALTTYTPTSVYDSCYIEKDTIIHGNVYKKYVYPLVHGYLTQEFLRDSADCIVDNRGIIRFSVNNFSTALNSEFSLNIVPPYDTIYKSSTWMMDKNVSTTVPAGTFNTINAQTRYHILPPYNVGGTFRNRNTRYALGIGPVLMTQHFYLTLNTYKELRLVRYHLN